jgi:uncharacterized protein (TIGR03437 family)
LPFLLTLCLAPVFAQAPQAILVDGPGPWQTAQWTFTVSQFSGILTDAGYSITTVSPANLPSALTTPGALVAVPSLASIPNADFQAIDTFVLNGGSLMASGGPPFSDPLSLTPSGQWLDANAYQQAVGSPPPQGPYFIQFEIPTVWPAREQYTNSAGLQVPVARNRGIFSSSNSIGRYRVIGDLLSPAATIFADKGVIVWLPWPQLYEPYRTELVSALETASSGLHFLTAGADLVVWPPGETITGGLGIVNAGAFAVQASVQWSIAGASGVTAQPPMALTLAPQGYYQGPITIGVLPEGDYTLSFRLMVGNQEMDRVDSPVRVLDPTLTRQPDQKISVVNGAFVTAAGQHVFLRGVNYWPRYIAGLDLGVFNGRSWLEANQYDPGLVEADLAEIASLGFNLVNIQYSDYIDGWPQEGSSLIDFLERCRAHGIWVRISISTTYLNNAYNGQLSPTIDNYLQSAYLPGNDRVFAYELFWEPFVGTYNTGGAGEIVNGDITGVNIGRTLLDPDWLAWVNAQYGSLANAQQAWSFTAPLNATGQLTNPSDDQIQNDGPWRIMVAAYRRFLEDYLGRNIGIIARFIRRTDPETLLCYRNWITMTATHNLNTGYDMGTGAAHLDFSSPERYSPVLLWPDDRAYGLVTAYSRYRNGGKPVQWTEFGADVGASGATAATLAAQTSIVDTMMRQVADDGSNAASVWWWPGGYSPLDGTDFGIINPDGSPRASALDLEQWNTTFAAAPPDLVSNPPTTITVDRDADARGSYGLFLNYENSYVAARQAGMSVTLVDQGTGTDTSTMPLLQVGNPPYAGAGPLKFANAEFGGIHVVCPTLDVTVENGTSVALPAGGACQLTPTLVNTGEAQWLPALAAKGGVTLQTNAGNIALGAPLASLERTAMGPLAIAMGQSTMTWTGRMQIAGVGSFGETLNLMLTVDSTSTGACALSFTPAGAVSIPAASGAGSIAVATASGCPWGVTSSETWLTPGAASGSGNGTVSYTVQGNYGPTRQATLTISGHPITVTQAGVSAPTLAPAPALSPASLTFGNQVVATAAAAQSVTVTNSGTSAVNLLSISIGGANNGDFSQTNNCGAALQPAASCTVQVVFTPTAVGARTASVILSGNLSGGPVAASLAGGGIGTGPTPAAQAVADVWDYTPGIAPGQWVTLFGANLGGAPQSWTVPGTQLPTNVGNVAVTFNGAPAAISYVSAAQINALVPASVTPGPVQVVVQLDGVNGSSFAATAKATQPAVYALPNADGSAFWVTAALAGTATLVGNSAIDPRVVRAVYPGDTIDLYMIGLGATQNPADFITNAVFAGAFPLAASVTASVGGEPANVLFSGLTTPGLYLVRIVVPSDLAAGAQALQVTAGGAQTRGSLLLDVGTAGKE